MSRILTIIFIIISVFVTSGEAGGKKEIEGILITASCDTIHGFIRKTSVKKLFKNIRFRPSDSKEYKVYRPEHIEEFISEEFSILSHRIVLNNVSQYIFIKKVYDGGLDLYYSWIKDNPDLFNSCNDLYFIGFDEERIIQMQQRLLIQTLTVIFKDCDCVLQEIDTDKMDYFYYDYKKLLSFVTAYDNCKDARLAMNSRQRKIRALNP
jgi:hypothetical protein